MSRVPELVRRANPWRWYYKIHRRARVRFILGMSSPDDLERLSQAELKSLVVKQWEQLVELQRVVMALRDEVARLKGGPGRPNIKPSGMERGTEPKRPVGSGSQKPPRGSTRSKLSIDEEQPVARRRVLGEAVTRHLGERSGGLRLRLQSALAP
jgi:hypothetical protein